MPENPNVIYDTEITVEVFGSEKVVYLSHSELVLTPGVVGGIEGIVQEYISELPEAAVTHEDLDVALEEHRNEETPHKAYDQDIPSLSLIFENGLV